MKKIILSLCLSISFARAQAENYFRNIIILLDQEGTVENIGKPNYFLSSKLQAALSEQTCPIIINAALWNGFIERRLSISQLSEIDDSPEQKALKLYDDINKQLNYWSDYYKEKHFDQMHAKQLMIEKVNEEFYTKQSDPDDEKSNVVDRGLNIVFTAYLTHFDQNDWEIFSNGKSFYILVPKKYLKKLEEEGISLPKNKKFNEKEIMLGLKVDHLIRIDNGEDPSACYFDAIDAKHDFSACFSDFFITRQDLSVQELPYHWNIIFSGHGGSHYKEFPGKPMIHTCDPIIADLTPEDFHSVLEFCEKNITTNCFYYSTCHGAGNHIKMAFDDYENPIYHYPIICGCLADGYAHCLRLSLPFPDADKSPLKASDIIYENDTWHLKHDQRYKWDKFFDALNENSFRSVDLKWLVDALDEITAPTLSDSPLIRFAQTNLFVPVLPNKLTIINDELLRVKRDEQATQITINQSIVLVKSSVISIPIIIKNPVRIASLMPGHAQHYFEKITFKSNKNFLETFNPVEGNWKFDKHFLIDELQVPNDTNSSITKKLGLTAEKITAKNVLVHTQRDSLVRIFAQIEENYYMLTINVADYMKGQADLKGITKMTAPVSEIYIKKYQQLKEKINNDGQNQSAIA